MLWSLSFVWALLVSETRLSHVVLWRIGLFRSSLSFKHLNYGISCNRKWNFSVKHHILYLCSCFLKNTRKGTGILSVRWNCKARTGEIWTKAARRPMIQPLCQQRNYKFALKKQYLNSLFAILGMIFFLDCSHGRSWRKQFSTSHSHSAIRTYQIGYCKNKATILQSKNY